VLGTRAEMLSEVANTLWKLHRAGNAERARSPAASPAMHANLVDQIEPEPPICRWKSPGSGLPSESPGSTTGLYLALARGGGHLADG